MNDLNKAWTKELRKVKMNEIKNLQKNERKRGEAEKSWTDVWGRGEAGIPKGRLKGHLLPAPGPDVNTARPAPGWLIMNKENWPGKTN